MEPDPSVLDQLEECKEGDGDPHPIPIAKELVESQLRPMEDLAEDVVGLLLDRPADLLDNETSLTLRRSFDGTLVSGQQTEE